CPQQSARQAGKGAPSRGIGAARKRIDQEFDAVLSAHRTGNGAQHGGKNGRMRDRPQTNVTKNERERGSGISRKVSHARFMPSTGIAVSLPPAALTIAERAETVPVPSSRTSTITFSTGKRPVHIARPRAGGVSKTMRHRQQKFRLVKKIKFRPYFEIFGRFDVGCSRRVRNSTIIEGLFDAHCTSGAIDRSDPAKAL